MATPSFSTDHASNLRSLYGNVGTGAVPDWAGHTLALHFGLDPEGPWSLSESLLQTNRVLAALAKIQPNNRVLDVGCGIGGSSFWLARTHAAVVTGVSIVPPQIAFATTIAGNSGPSFW